MRKQYKNDEEKQALTEEFEGKGCRLTEIHNHSDGDFLVFGPKTEYHALDKDGKWLFDTTNYVEKEVRPTRNKLLLETDHLMLVDNYENLSSIQKIEVKLYRQRLRDLPNNIVDENAAMNIEWPVRYEDK